MLRQKRGFPLYVPAPQPILPLAYQSHGISIGDVGRVTPEGIFDFFFNIFLPPEDPINANRTPEGFSPMELHKPIDVSYLDYGPGTCVSTPTVEEVDVEAPFE
jgi:hypothetical protein